MTAKKFSRTQILRRRAQLMTVLDAFRDQPVTGNIIYEVADRLLSALPPVVSRNAVFESIRVLAGTTLSHKAAAMLAWRLAGNLDKLVDGEPVLPWTRQLYDEIVPVCVERVIPAKRRDKSGFIFSCRALAGSPCTELFPQFFSTNSCRAISRLVGFSTNSWGPYQYAGIGMHFVNLMFFAHIEAERSREKPYFRQVSVTSSMLKHNKGLLAVRCRTAPCPEGFQHACTNCFVGYNECPFAVHAKTYVESHCHNCDTVAFFDPESPGVMCVNCCRVNRYTIN
jgi:hypothetical protein